MKIQGGFEPMTPMTSEKHPKKPKILQLDLNPHPLGLKASMLPLSYQDSLQYLLKNELAINTPVVQF